MLIFEGFLKQVKENPDALALVDNKRFLTYKELFEKSCQLAATLNELDIKSQYVFILGTKSLESIIAILGTLFSGFTYVTLDINHPASRLDHIFSLLAPSGLILTGLNPRLQYEIKKMEEAPKYLLDLSGDVANDLLKESKRIQLKDHLIEPATYSDERIAYTLFTSGSTGQPKGVCISHRAASSALQMFQNHIKFKAHDIITNQAALCFDLSVFDIFGALNIGGALSLIPPEITALPDRFFQMITEQKTTSLYTTPSTLEFLLKNKIAAQENVYFRKILLSGEPTTSNLLNNIYDFFSETIEVWNIYGATEIPYVTAHRIEKGLNKDTNIFSLKDEVMEIKIRDPLYDSQKNISIGELLVRGPAILSGYIRTNNQKIISPLIEGDWYPTGDLAAIDSNNHVALYGRNDRQVKIKGYRIELDEVELQLANCPEIQEVAVVLSRQKQEIRAYLVLKPSHRSEEESLKMIKNFCEARLPDIFHPSILNVIEKMPYTTTGKKDRNTLVNL